MSAWSFLSTFIACSVLITVNTHMEGRQVDESETVLYNNVDFLSRFVCFGDDFV